MNDNIIFKKRRDSILSLIELNELESNFRKKDKIDLINQFTKTHPFITTSELGNQELDSYQAKQLEKYIVWNREVEL